jgi:hypothetical protein
LLSYVFSSKLLESHLQRRKFLFLHLESGRLARERGGETSSGRGGDIVGGGGGARVDLLFSLVG